MLGKLRQFKNVMIVCTVVEIHLKLFVGEGRGCLACSWHVREVAVFEIISSHDPTQLLVWKATLLVGIAA